MTTSYDYMIKFFRDTFRSMLMLAIKNSAKLLLSGSIAGIAIALLVSPSSESLALQNKGLLEDSAFYDSRLDMSTPSIALGEHKPDSASSSIESHQQYEQKTVKIRRGDTLGKLLQRAGIEKGIAYKATTSLCKIFNPKHLKPKQKITLNYAVNNGEKEFISITIEPKIGHRITAKKNESNGFSSFEEHDTLKSQLMRFEGKIRSSLLSTAIEKGVPKSVTYNFAKLFSNIVDFQKDIRSGDSFQIMYEQFVDTNGNNVKIGKILFASLVLRNEKIALYRYADKKGNSDYYDSNGQSVRKALSRRPISGARITSGYGMRRHPILRYKRMHWGIDYAAPRGTPIYAGGDGVVEHAGRKGAYGKYIKIRHNSTYQTAYAHLRRYAKGIRKNKRVKKGQVIGYVGSTGRSTGPHLHYEILKNGRHVNPLRVKIPCGRKLNRKEMKGFSSARMKITRTYTAMASSSMIANRSHIVASNN